MVFILFLIISIAQIHKNGLAKTLYPKVYFLFWFFSVGTIIAMAIYSSIIPFNGGGDDLTYFKFSQAEIQTLGDVFSFSAIRERYTQIGYAVMLYWLANIFGHSLLLLKVFNFFAFIGVLLVWVKILKLTNYSREVINAFFVLSLFAMPLWHYFYFLNKDIVIVLLQSIIILQFILLKRTIVSTSRIFYLLLFIILLSLFRLELAMANVVIIFSLLFFLSDKKFNRRIVISFVIVGIIGGVLYLFPLVDLLGLGKKLSMYDKTEETIGLYKNKYGIVGYTFLYLFKDVSWINPASLDLFLDKDTIALAIRNYFSVIWGIIIVPSFIGGVSYLAKKNRYRTDFVLAMFGYFLFYFIVGYFSGDSVRWTIQVIPIFLVVGSLGWVYEKQKVFPLILSFVMLSMTIFIYRLI